MIEVKESPAKVGTLVGAVGQATVPVGVTVPVPLVPVAVTLCVCEASLPVEPEMLSAGTVPPVPVNVGAATVPAGVKLTVPLVPEGVPALTAEVVLLSPVNIGALTLPAGVPALTALVVLLSPVKVGCETVPTGVMLSAPPVVPTSRLAANVPMTVNPFRSAASMKVAGHEPEVMSKMDPDGTPPPADPISSHAPVPQS